MAKKSIMTDNMKACYICGAPRDHIHHIFGGYLSKNRQHSDEDGLFIPVCAKCHDEIHNGNQALKNGLHMQAQLKYEQTHTREEFRKRYGKSYL